MDDIRGASTVKAESDPHLGLRSSEQHASATSSAGASKPLGMSGEQKMALSVRHMLMHAIFDHNKREFKAGRLPVRRPRRFELHPAVVRDLTLELQPEEIYCFGTKDPDKMMFHGVEIVADRLATRPKMINADNVVEYL